MTTPTTLSILPAWTPRACRNIPAARRRERRPRRARRSRGRRAPDHAHFAAVVRGRPIPVLRHFLAQSDLATRKVLGVTSPAAGDGKTTTAVNLAITLAQSAGARVLLIDADLRRPFVGTSLGLERTASRAWPAALDPDSRAGRVIRARRFNLDVLPAGPSTPNAYRLLDSPRIGKLLEQARGAVRPCRPGYAARPPRSGLPPDVPVGGWLPGRGFRPPHAAEAGGRRPGRDGPGKGPRRSSSTATTGRSRATSRATGVTTGTTSARPRGGRQWRMALEWPHVKAHFVMVVTVLREARRQRLDALLACLVRMTRSPRSRSCGPSSCRCRRWSRFRRVAAGVGAAAARSAGS